MSTNGNGSMTPEEIEAEIARTRSDLTATLEALEDKLAPRQLLERGFDMVRHSMDGQMSAGRIGAALKDNPIPLALIGAGIGWLLLSKTGAGHRAGAYTSRYASRLGSTLGDAAGSVGERVKGMIGRGGSESGGDYAHAWTKREESARDTTADLHPGAYAGTEMHGGDMGSERRGGTLSSVGEYGRHAWDSVGEYAGSAGRQVGQVRDRFGQLMEEYPLAVGALGFLAGAVVAATLPSTRLEDEYLGETRDDLWRQAEAAGRDALDRAQEMASTAVSAATDAARDAVSQTAEAVKEEAQRQGLTGDDRKV